MAKLFDILKANIPAFRNSSFPDIRYFHRIKVIQELQADGSMECFQEIPTD
jgi:hypothetical protein